MSKKKKQKKNKKSHVQGGGAVSQSSNLNVNESKGEQKLIAADEVVKLENKPVDFLSEGAVSTSETKSEINMSGEGSTLEMEFKADAEKGEGGISKQESKLKKDLEREAHITLESEAEHRSHENKSPNNFIPFWTGIVVGALLTFLFL